MKRKIDRFLEYLDKKGISENKATVDCQLSQGLLYRAKIGMSDIGNKAVEKILETYADLSRVWLLTGEGEMLKISESKSISTELAADDRMVERLLVLLAEKDKDMRVLIDMLKEKDEKIEELRKELDARKGKTASGADGSSVANVG